MFTVPYKKKSAPQTLDCVNWPGEYPYKPQASFRIWHDGKYLYIEYTVKEQTTKAEVSVPGQFVYMDSCVEFFVQPLEEDPHYYNFEWNPIGTLYLGYRTGRNDAEHPGQDILLSVEAEASEGTQEFGEREIPGCWSLLVKIPATALWHSGTQSRSGRRMKANFYKCGDGLKTPHFLSWAPIDTPVPDFHRPEFFVPIEFEAQH